MAAAEQLSGNCPRKAQQPFEAQASVILGWITWVLTTCRRAAVFIWEMLGCVWWHQLAPTASWGQFKLSVNTPVKQRILKIFSMRPLGNKG